MKMSDCAVIAGLCAVTAVAQAAPGDLDLTFAGTGKSRVGLGGAIDSGHAVAVQTDGRIVVVGSRQRIEGGVSVSDFSVARYLADGSRDTSFDGDGKVITRLATSATALAVKLQTDGKIVVAGQKFLTQTTSEIAVVRYHPNGALDHDFGGDGIVTTNPGGIARGEAVLIQGDGNIVVTGNGLAVRYLTNGMPDPAFGGGDGIAPGGANVGRGAALQSDGKILLCGGSCGGSFIITCSVAVARLNMNGTPDMGFDGDGLAVTSLPSFSEFGNAVAIQLGDNTALNPDKIVVVGSAVPDTVVLRYDLNGSPDNSLDGDGNLIVSLGAGNEEANSIGFQTSGISGANRIVISGFAETATGFDFVVARLFLNGGFDGAFDGEGIALTPVSAAGDDRGRGMVIRSGLITVAGIANGDFGIVRYNLADGSLDPTLDGDGKKVDDVGDVFAIARGVAIQTDGRIVVAGSTVDFQNSFAALRYNVDGSLDSSFDGDGKVITLLNGTARAAAIQSDGKILLAGSIGTGASSDFAVARYLSNGSLDPDFNGDGNNDGIIVSPIGSGEDVAHAVAVQGDGRIVLAGTAHNGSNFDFAAARYNENGSPDMSFDGDGEAITPIGAGNDEGRAITIQADGKIVVAGFSSNGTNTDFAVVRYKAIDGTLDVPAFSFDGKVTTPILAGNDGANAIAMDGTRIVVAGFANNGANNDFAVVRYTSDGTPDNLFDTDGKLTTEIGVEDAAGAVRIDVNGKIVVAGFSFTGVNNDFALVRYTSNGTLDATYGTGGRVTVDFGPSSSDLGFAMTLDSIGRAVVAGEADGIFGTARVLGDPFLKITSISRDPTNADITLEGLGVPGLANSLRDSINLSTDPFDFLNSVLPDASGFWQFDQANPGDLRFYRLTFP